MSYLLLVCKFLPPFGRIAAILSYAANKCNEAKYSKTFHVILIRLFMKLIPIIATKYNISFNDIQF